MPRDRGATRPGRGSVARDGAHPLKTKREALGQHTPNVGCRGRKVKLGRDAAVYRARLHTVVRFTSASSSARVTGTSYTASRSSLSFGR